MPNHVHPQSIDRQCLDNSGQRSPLLGIGPGITSLLVDKGGVHGDDFAFTVMQESHFLPDGESAEYLAALLGLDLASVLFSIAKGEIELTQSKVEVNKTPTASIAFASLSSSFCTPPLELCSSSLALLLWIFF